MGGWQDRERSGAGGTHRAEVDDRAEALAARLLATREGRPFRVVEPVIDPEAVISGKPTWATWRTEEHERVLATPAAEWRANGGRW